MAHPNGTAVPTHAARPGRIDRTADEEALAHARIALENRFPVAFTQWLVTREMEADGSPFEMDELEALFDAIATGVDAKIWPDMGMCGGEPATSAEFYDAARKTAWDRRKARGEDLRNRVTLLDRICADNPPGVPMLTAVVTSNGVPAGVNLPPGRTAGWWHES